MGDFLTHTVLLGVVQCYHVNLLR